MQLYTKQQEIIDSIRQKYTLSIVGQKVSANNSVIFTIEASENVVFLGSVINVYGVDNNIYNRKYVVVGIDGNDIDLKSVESKFVYDENAIFIDAYLEAIRVYNDEVDPKNVVDIDTYPVIKVITGGSNIVAMTNGNISYTDVDFLIEIIFGYNEDILTFNETRINAEYVTIDLLNLLKSNSRSFINRVNSVSENSVITFNVSFSVNYTVT